MIFSHVNSKFRTHNLTQAARNARIAVQFVINYEEGGENCIVGGSYHDDLVRTPNGWRIKHRRLEQRWMDGNPNVLKF